MASMTQAPKKLLFLGDSLIEFFDWQSRFPEHRVYNLGVAGETVEGLLSRIYGIVQYLEKPDFIFIMTGINNVAMEHLDFIRSYRSIIGILVNAFPGSRIYIHNLTTTLFDWIPEESIKEVNLSLKKVAEEMGIGYIDIHRLFLDYAGNRVQDLFLPDGVHISDEGYEVWSHEVAGIIGDESRVHDTLT
jgi:lysophospholipase L1-like esterase